MTKLSPSPKSKPAVGLADDILKHALVLALSIKESFDGGDKEFQVNFIITYYFR